MIAHGNQGLVPGSQSAQEWSWATRMDLSLIDPPCFIGSCKAQGGSLRMASFSKERVPSTIFTV